MKELDKYVKKQEMLEHIRVIDEVLKNMVAGMGGGKVPDYIRKMKDDIDRKKK